MKAVPVGSNGLAFTYHYSFVVSITGFSAINDEELDHDGPSICRSSTPKASASSESLSFLRVKLWSSDI